MCLSPFIKKYKKENLSLPCGKCTECKGKRISGWSFRLLKEAEVSLKNYFLTLTYAPEKVPRTEKNFKTINKTDLQKYFKKLRKNGIKFKYYAVGEYGTNTSRPHYHIIMLIYSIQDTQMEKNSKVLQRTLEDHWTHGYIHFGETTPASTTYTLKYISKPSKIPQHKNDDRLPEFSLMSKKMGLGYITPAMKKWHLADLENRMYIQMKDGQKISMPRYFKNIIYTDKQRKRVAQYVSDPVGYKETIKNNHSIPEKTRELWLKRLKNTQPTKTYEQIIEEMIQNELIRINEINKSHKETRLNPKL